MKNILFFIFVIFAVLFGQNKEFTKLHTYVANNDDSRNSAKAKAMEEAQTALLQELGVLVEARQKMTTTASNGNLQQNYIEELKTYTIGKVQTSIVDGTEKFVENVYSATFKMLVDTADLYKHLDNIVKRKQQATADSLAKAKKVSELELTVKTARNLLEQEQEREKPLRIVKEQKERESQDAESQKNSAQKNYDNARYDKNAHTDIGAQRTESERKLLQKATDERNKKSAEYKIAYENWNNANRRVETAKNNLQTTEKNLANETGMKNLATATEISAEATNSTSLLPYYYIRHFSLLKDKETQKKQKDKETQKKTKEKIEDYYKLLFIGARIGWSFGRDYLWYDWSSYYNKDYTVWNLGDNYNFWLSDVSDYDYDSKANSFDFAPFVSVQLAKYFAIQVEMVFTSYNYLFYEKKDVQHTKYSLSKNMIMIPVLPAVTIGKKRFVKIFGGPHFNIVPEIWMWKWKRKDSEVHDVTYKMSSQNFKDNYGEFYNAPIGLTWGISTGYRVFLDARWSIDPRDTEFPIVTARFDSKTDELLSIDSEMGGTLRFRFSLSIGFDIGIINRRW